MPVTYEWDRETLTVGESEEYEDNECLDHMHARSFAEAKASLSEAPPDGCRFALVLVREDDEQRSWAYLEDDGTLPPFFMCAYGNEYRKVPKRFHDEVARA